MSFFSKLFKKKSKESLPEKPFEEIYNDLGIFEYFDDNFKVQFKSSFLIVNWSEINKIVAYKKDLITYDLVVMEVVLENKSFKITEETPGWFQFVIRLKEIFESIPKDWDLKIIQPAFEENFVTIYERK